MIPELNAILREVAGLSVNRKFDEIIDRLPDNILAKFKSPDLYAEKALALVDAGRFDQAEAFLNSSFEIPPVNSRLFFARGYFFQHKNMFENARISYSRALSLNSNDPLSLINRGICLAALGNYQNAKEDLEKVLSLEPNSCLVKEELGLIYFELEEWENAIEFLRETLSHTGNRALISKKLAVAFFKIKKYADVTPITEWLIANGETELDMIKMAALSYWILEDERCILLFKKVADEEPINTQYLLYLGKGQLQFGNPESAVESFSRLVALIPDSSGYIERSAAFAACNNYEAALQDLDAALAIEPLHKLGNLNRAICLHRLKRYEDALETFQSCKSIDPFNFRVFFGKGLCLFQMRNFLEALPAFDQANTLNPGDADILLDRGACLSELGNYDMALADIDEAAKINNNYRVFAFRGNVYAALQDFQSARNEFSVSIAHDPTHAWVYNNRANAFIELESLEEAILDLQTSLGLDPDHAETFFFFSRVYYSQEKYSQAIANFYRAVWMLYQPFSTIIKNLKDKYFCPFLLNRLLLSGHWNKTFLSRRLDWADNYSYCSDWDGILYLLNRLPEVNAQTLFRVKAMVNYFMGDCLNAFKIFDENLDGPDMPQLTCRDQYYFVKSAMSFLEPHREILKAAIASLVEHPPSTTIEIYYAASLYTLNGDFNRAIDLFESAAESGFDPALYSLHSIYEHKHDIKEKSKIVARLQKRFANGGLDPIKKCSEIKLADADNLLHVCIDAVELFALYDENADEIRNVDLAICTDAEKPKIHPEFWRIINIDGYVAENLQREIDRFELQEFESELCGVFAASCNRRGNAYFQEQIFNNGVAEEAFGHMEQQVTRYPLLTSYEKQIALAIMNMKLRHLSVHWILAFINLLFLEKKISARQAIILFLFAEKKAIEIKDQEYTELINIELQIWLSGFISIGSPLIRKGIYKAFRFLQDGFENPHTGLNQYLDYEGYKAEFLIHLSLWRGTIAEKLSAA